MMICNVDVLQRLSMEIIALLLIVYFFIGACICLLICVNPNDPGVLGSLNRFMFKKIPTIFSNFIRKIFGETVLNCLGGIKHYLMETNHPIVMIFYLLISPGGFDLNLFSYSLYLIKGIFKHMPNESVSGPQVAIASILAFVCFWVYYKACATEPGKVTSQNAKHYIEKYKQYYDGEIYKERNKCRTCLFDKPARSKHCSICQMCVSKYDHHCVWIRQCVGEKNYKYFVSFLGLHSIWCLYLSVIGALSLIQYLNRIHFYDMRFQMEGKVVVPDGLLALQYLFMTETIFFFLIVMCAIMGITLLIFVIYHLYLIGVGQTTNQRVKKNDDIQYYTKEIKTCKQIQSKFKDGVNEVDWKGEMFKKDDIEAYERICHKNKAILERVIDKKGFLGKLKDVFSL